MARVEERGSELNRLTISRANVPSAIKGGRGESEDRSRYLAASPMNRRVLRVHSCPLSSPQHLRLDAVSPSPRQRCIQKEKIRFARTWASALLWEEGEWRTSCRRLQETTSRQGSYKAQPRFVGSHKSRQNQSTRWRTQLSLRAR